MILRDNDIESALWARGRQRALIRGLSPRLQEFLLNSYRFGGASLSYGATVLADGPVAYFRLAETSGDAVNSILTSETGALSAGVTRGAAPLTPDAGDKAMSFSGSTSYIGCITGNYRYDTTFTHEALIKIASGALTVGGASLGVLSKGQAGAYTRVTPTSTAGVGNLQFLKSRTSLLGTSIATLTEGVIYHLAVTSNAAGVSTIYINGSASGTGTASTALGGEGIIQIGSDYYGGVRGEYFKGVIDEVAIYNKVLSAGRILAHAQAAGLA